MTKSNWREYLQSYIDHTIKTGATFNPKTAFGME